MAIPAGWCCVVGIRRRRPDRAGISLSLWMSRLRASMHVRSAQRAGGGGGGIIVSRAICPEAGRATGASGRALYIFILFYLLYTFCTFIV